MSNNTIIQRVVDWNSARYPQVYNHQLQVSLLTEEVQELAEAQESPVDTLDALCDITYVAIGAMWKLGLSPDQIAEALHIVCDSNDSKSLPAHKVDPAVKANKSKGDSFVPPEPALKALLERANVPV